MSTSLKAFATHSLFTTNTRLVEHTFGEISTESRTYEKDVQLYSHNTDKSIGLVLFSYRENNNEIAVPVEKVNYVLDIAKSVYDYLTSSAREIYKDELKNKLLDLHRTTSQHFQVGEIVNDGEYYCPQYVVWEDLEGNHFHLWFSDASFQSEYDQFEIEVVPPVDKIDIFFSTRSEVEKELAKTPVDLLTKKANAKKAHSPVTVFRLDIFKWHNPVSGNPELDTNWYILIWGDAGDNIDAIKEKLQAEILSKSKHNRDEWKRIFPEIFTRSEFIIVPQWDVFSNENKIKSKASLYSPFVRYKDALPKYAIPFMTDMSEEHIKEHMQITSLYYRSIAAITCGSPENKDNKFHITDVFPDYIDVPSTSTDFNYQDVTTQKWSIKIQEMLHIAEEMTETSALPRERITLNNGQVVNGEKIYSRVIRNGKLFLTMKFGDYHYLIAAKKTIS
jgi:PHIKZ157|nr:MAG TPA: structural protein [Caudoviricetes sp.]